MIFIQDSAQRGTVMETERKLEDLFSLLEIIILKKQPVLPGSQSSGMRDMFNRLKEDFVRGYGSDHSFKRDKSINLGTYRGLITPGLVCCLATQDFETYTRLAEYLGADFLEVMPGPAYVARTTKHLGDNDIIEKLRTKHGENEEAVWVKYWMELPETHQNFLKIVWDKYWEIYAATTHAANVKKRREEIRAVSKDQHEAA